MLMCPLPPWREEMLYKIACIKLLEQEHWLRDCRKERQAVI